MNPLNGKWPERIIRGIAKRPMLTTSALSLSLRFGKDAYGLQQGKIQKAEFLRRGGGHLGGTGLGALGMFTGVFLSPVPVLGAFVGAAVGEKLGEKLGQGLVKKIQAAMGIEVDAPAAPSAAAAAAAAGVHTGYAGGAHYQATQAPPAEDDEAS